MEVLVEQNFCGKAETSYVYGVDRLSADNYWGLSTYYLYDGRGSVTGLTGEKGWIYQSYRYSVTGEITFGEPHHNNEYTYNGESYNPNIESQYLRARYYNVVTATFLTEDSYLGEITNPLTLNRYNYTLSNYLNYQDPSGHDALGEAAKIAVNMASIIINNSKTTVAVKDVLPQAGGAEVVNPNLVDIYNQIKQMNEIGIEDEIEKYLRQFNYSERYIEQIVMNVETYRKIIICEPEIENDTFFLTEEEKVFISVIAAEAGGEEQLAWEAIAQIIMNRYKDRRDGWKNAESVMDIVTSKIQFNGYGDDNYQLAYEYLEARDGLNTRYEQIIAAVLPYYYGEKELFELEGVVLYYSPKSMRKDKYGNPTVPNFAKSDAVEEVFLKGIDSNDFRFFKYK